MLNITRLEVKKFALSAARAFLAATVVFQTPIAEKIAEGISSGSFDTQGLRGLSLALLAAGFTGVVRFLQARFTNLEPTQ